MVKCYLRSLHDLHRASEQGEIDFWQLRKAFDKMPVNFNVEPCNHGIARAA